MLIPMDLHLIRSNRLKKGLMEQQELLEQLPER